MLLRASAVWFLLGGCSERASPDREREELAFAQVWEHGREVTRWSAAGDALKTLLIARRDGLDSELDRAIRELSLVVCGLAEVSVVEKMKSDDIDGLYPTSMLEQCTVMHCGGCFVAATRLYLYGTAFCEFPKWYSESHRRFIGPGGETAPSR